MSRKKMNLESLLNSSGDKGIEKITDFANMEKKEVQKKEPVIKVNKKLPKRMSVNSNSTLPSMVDTSVPKKEKAIRGRPAVYNDPRYKSMEPVRISINTKIKLQSLIDQKFDGYSQSQMIDLLVDFYMSKELSKEEQKFFSGLIDTQMEDVKSTKKYSPYFKD